MLLFQTEEWTSEQRKSHRYQESSGNEDKLEKYIRHRCVISMNRILAIFIVFLIALCSHMHVYVTEQHLQCIYIYTVFKLFVIFSDACYNLGY